MASVPNLDAAKKQAQQLKRSVGALAKRVNGLLAAIGEEQQRRSHDSTPNPLTPESTPVRQQRHGGERGFYDGRVTFGRAQMKDGFVPTICQMLDDFPECTKLGYCKVRVGDDVRRGIDYARMTGYSVSDLEGHQSTAVGLEEWSGPAGLAGMVCSLFVAPDASDDEEIRRQHFIFPDMEAAERAAPGDELLRGYELFSAAVEGACAADKKPYLVIPSECTSEWRRTAGLPQEPCVDCGARLRQTAGRIAGVHTPYEYISSAAQSGTGLHVEDALLCSANIVLAGAPKVWLVVPPDNLAALESRMRQLGDSLRPIQPCSQFVRHLNALLSPRLLEEWGIEFDIVTCRAGEMVVTLPGAYHQVLNSGPNYAQAVNFALPDWAGPPEGYRFCCEEEYPNPNAPKAGHFRVLDGEASEDEESDEESETEIEVEVDEEVDEQAEEEEREEAELDDEQSEEVGEEAEGAEEEGDPERESDEEEQVGRSEAGDTTQFSPFEALSTHVTTVLTNPRKRYALSLGEMSESDSSGSDDSDGSNDDHDDHDDHNSDDGEECTMCAECAKSSDSGARNGRDDNRSFQVQIRGSAAGDAISVRRPTTMQQSDIERWSKCVLRTAKHRGFNAEAVFTAFYNAPPDQPIVKVLRTLQCICEVANIPLLLQLRQHLLANPKGTAAATKASDTPMESSQDIGALVRIHQNISTLRTVSWITQYELAINQLEYYQQFEAVVKTRKADTKKATDERRNRKKRLVRRGATDGIDVVSATPRPVQTQVVVKEEIVSIMMKQGRSELAAKDELEQYLKHGKTLHLLLESANPDLLPLLPLYEAKEKLPSLDLLAHNPPDKVPDSDKKELAKPITSSQYVFLYPAFLKIAYTNVSMNGRVFKLSHALAKYFGQQLFVARPELKDYEQETRNRHSGASSIVNLIKSAEQEVVATKPAEVARLFRFNRS